MKVLAPFLVLVLALGVGFVSCSKAPAPTEPGLEKSADLTPVADKELLEKKEDPIKGTKVAIDIKPGNEDNVVNPKSNGRIKVAILSSGKLKEEDREEKGYFAFDAPTQVDPTSLTFGLKGYEDSFASVQKQPHDVNGDGLDDMVCFFHTDKTNFEYYLDGKYKETTGTLRGRYSDDLKDKKGKYVVFYGVDYITVVPDDNGDDDLVKKP